MRSRARQDLAGPTASPQGQSFPAPPPPPGEQCCAPKTRTWRRGRRPCAGCSLPGAQRPPCAPGRGTRAFPSGGAALAAGSWVCTRVGACGDGCALGATIELRCARESGACPPPRAPAPLLPPWHFAPLAPGWHFAPFPGRPACRAQPPFSRPIAACPCPGRALGHGPGPHRLHAEGPTREPCAEAAAGRGGAGGAGLRAGRRGSRCALSARRRRPRPPEAGRCTAEPGSRRSRRGRSALPTESRRAKGQAPFRLGQQRAWRGD